MFYPTDEQLQKGFGDDVILVRGSCGAGTLRGWDGSQATDIKPVAFRGQRLIASGPVRTIADAEVKGWEYQGKELNMINRYTLYAGHRDAQVDVLFDQPLDKETFCTGVQKYRLQRHHVLRPRGTGCQLGNRLARRRHHQIQKRNSRSGDLYSKEIHQKGS